MKPTKQNKRMPWAPVFACVPWCPPLPQFEIGDCAVGVSAGTSSGNIIFITDRVWSEELKTWRYGIQYTQASMSDLDKWSGGGGSFWWSECDIRKPEGEQLLWGTLWKKYRQELALGHQLKTCQEEITKLRFSLELLKKT